MDGRMKEVAIPKPHFCPASASLFFLFMTYCSLNLGLANKRAWIPLGVWRRSLGCSEALCTHGDDQVQWNLVLLIHLLRDGPLIQYFISNCFTVPSSKDEHVSCLTTIHTLDNNHDSQIASGKRLTKYTKPSQSPHYKTVNKSQLIALRSEI